MSETAEKAAVEPKASFLVLGTTLLRGRWRILRFLALGATSGVVISLLRPPIYDASASFVPQASENERSTLSSLAGQFGVALPSSNSSQSPDFYVRLLRSRSLLDSMALDTLSVPEEGTGRVAVIDLFKIKGRTQAIRRERTSRRLAEAIHPTALKNVGVVDLTVSTRWPSVSLAIARRLLELANEFNQHTRQSQALAERKFLESRIGVAREDLRVAEDALQRFLSENREFGGSPALIFSRDRLQREVSLRQQLYTTLMQSYDDVRLREVRDTPIISMVEQPAVLPEARSRGIVLAGLAGAFLGAAVGLTVVVGGAALRRRRAEGGVELEQFIGTVDDVRDELRIRRRSRTDRPA